MEQKRKSLEHGNGGRANELGIVLPDLLFGRPRAECGFIAWRHGTFRRASALAACHARAASAPWSRFTSFSDRRTRRRKRSLVERVLADDFSLLVWRGGVLVVALWKLCCARRFGA